MNPTSDPSTGPSAAPTMTPTAKPSAVPSFRPTTKPSPVPSERPSIVPSVVPTYDCLPQCMANPYCFFPTNYPTTIPTVNPTSRPSATPTRVPTAVPSARPSSRPTSVPTTQVQFVYAQCIVSPFCTGDYTNSGFTVGDTSVLAVFMRTLCEQQSYCILPTAQPSPVPTQSPSSLPTTSTSPSAGPTPAPYQPSWKLREFGSLYEFNYLQMTQVWTTNGVNPDATTPYPGTTYTYGTYCTYYYGATLYLIANTPGCFMYKSGVCYAGTGTQCNVATYTGSTAVFTLSYEYY